MLCFPPLNFLLFCRSIQTLRNCFVFQWGTGGSIFPALGSVFCPWSACWAFWLYSILKSLTGSLIPGNNHSFSLMHTLKGVIIVSGVISHNYYRVIIITLVPRSSNYTTRSPLSSQVFLCHTENIQSLSSQPYRELGGEIRKLQPVQEVTASVRQGLHFTQNN